MRNHCLKVITHYCLLNHLFTGACAGYLLDNFCKGSHVEAC